MHRAPSRGQRKNIEIFKEWVTAEAAAHSLEGMKVLYLPPYSPDLNPIEKMWSKMKALLCGWKVRSLDLLPDAVRMALDSVSQLDCLHWFAASAYC